MKISEFWTLLGISEEQSKFFDENIPLLTDNQKSAIKKKIEDDINEYQNKFGEAKGRGVSAKKKTFAELHFSSIYRRINSYAEINNMMNSINQEWKENSERELKEMRNDRIKNKIKNMELKEKVVCTHCQTVGGVYVRQGKDIVKTRVNSLAARVIGLGTNTEKDVIEFLCTNCEMEWKIDN